MNKLRNIKIGDKVIVGKGGSSDRIAEVGFVSDTQIQVNGLRYNILDGRLVGTEEGEKDRIIPATDKEIKRVRRNERKKVCNVLNKNVFIRVERLKKRKVYTNIKL